ncbi:MAG: SufD family Fe-S cluster assembly protein [Xylanivirga thermophila]|uniref:SufB/SufD family protein n=1 Tax=Xylanivirga thermophila TaxID=2496273 RepID=UPI00101D703A|nr:SufD family Fe-S cluster assembly protein [Xylanivirga thermophila]
MLNTIDKQILEQVAGLHDVPQGAYNIRKNGKALGRNSTANIDIIPKKDKPGIDIIVKPGTKKQSVHIPVILSASGMNDMVYNSFDIGEGSDVLVVAGCGIHNPGNETAEHDGVHEFVVHKGARMKYVEKHYGQGQGTGKRILNPVTYVEVEEDGVAELELVQIKGVDYTKRDTRVKLHKNARLIVTERLLTSDDQEAYSIINVELLGEDSSAQIISRSVAQGNSKQVFNLNLLGKNRCRGHIQCDSIIMDNANVSSIPEISAYHADAQLIHEAAIGKIASEQLLKLQSLGYSQKEAEDIILEGFLK